MNKLYLVFRNGLLYTRCITRMKAQQIVNELRKKDHSAAVAYDISEEEGQ